MVWNRKQIILELRKQHRAGRDLSYNASTRTRQKLVSAAAYHFGSYRAAVEAAKIDYSVITHRPRWTAKQIIALIRQAGRNGEDLHWGAVTRRRDELGKAAFASLQPRLFGKWELALRAAGMDPAKVSKYRRWKPEQVVTVLRTLAKDGRPLNSGAIQRSDPGLHAAAVRYFSGFESALRAARLDPGEHRLRQAWTKADVIKAIRTAARNGDDLSDSSIRRSAASLYGASHRLFGSFVEARQAAGIKFDRKKTM